MTTDYAKMTSNEMVEACGSDASKWAAAFQQIVVDGGLEIDEGLMIGWFANAIMYTHDKLTGTAPVVLPDGSAYIVGTVK